MLYNLNFLQLIRLTNKNIIETIYPTTWKGCAWKRLVGKFYVIDEDGCKVHLELQESKQLVIDNGQGEKYVGTWRSIVYHEGSGQIGTHTCHLFLRYEANDMPVNQSYRIVFHKDNLLIIHNRELKNEKKCVFLVEYDRNERQNEQYRYPKSYDEAVDYMKLLAWNHQKCKTLGLMLAYANICMAKGIFFAFFIAFALMFTPLMGNLTKLFPDCNIGDMSIGFAFGLLLCMACIIAIFNQLTAWAVCGYKAKCLRRRPFKANDMEEAEKSWYTRQDYP